MRGTSEHSLIVCVLSFLHADSVIHTFKTRHRRLSVRHLCGLSRRADTERVKTKKERMLTNRQENKDRFTVHPL